MAVFVSEDDITAGYEDVRNDDTDTTWALFGYESEGNGKKIEFRGSGTNYDELLSCMEDDQRLYAYVRFETGDEMSRRAKFAFITWIGPGVSALKKGKVSTDKAFVKKIVVNFGKEILADEKSEVKYEKVLSILEKASGAAYGTGK